MQTFQNLLESVLEFLGHSSEIFGFSHDFADQSLLAIKIVIVEFFIDILEHGDPLDDVHSLVAIGIIVGSIDFDEKIYIISQNYI